MLSLHIFRRFRRPLLLPPGWLALGWLLLLGCLALRAHWRQLRPVNVLQLTMFPLKADTSLVAFYRLHGPGREAVDYNPYIDTDGKNALAKIARMRSWHTIDFGGQSLTDFFNAQLIESAIRLINADSSHAGGVRIRFRAGATYTSLVKVLDIMNYTDQKKYWLDNRHRPAIFYAITNKELPKYPRKVMMSGCVLPLDNIPSPPTLPLWQRLLAEYWSPAWRLPWLLLLALGVLGMHKVRKAS